MLECQGCNSWVSVSSDRFYYDCYNYKYNSVIFERYYALISLIDHHRDRRKDCPKVVNLVKLVKLVNLVNVVNLVANLVAKLVATLVVNARVNRVAKLIVNLVNL